MMSISDHSIAAICVGAIIGYAAAQHKGYSPIAGIVCGALMGPILSWVLFAIDGIIQPNERERCPHRREWVNPGAAVCHHCGNRVVVPAPNPGPLRLVHSRRD